MSENWLSMEHTTVTPTGRPPLSLQCIQTQHQLVGNLGNLASCMFICTYNPHPSTGINAYRLALHNVLVDGAPAQHELAPYVVPNLPESLIQCAYRSVISWGGWWSPHAMCIQPHTICACCIRNSHAITTTPMQSPHTAPPVDILGATGECAYYQYESRLQRECGSELIIKLPPLDEQQIAQLKADAAAAAAAAAKVAEDAAAAKKAAAAAAAATAAGGAPSGGDAKKEGNVSHEQHQEKGMSHEQQPERSQQPEHSQHKSEHDHPATTGREHTAGGDVRPSQEGGEGGGGGGGEDGSVVMAGKRRVVVELWFEVESEAGVACWEQYAATTNMVCGCVLRVICVWEVFIREGDVSQLCDNVEWTHVRAKQCLGTYVCSGRHCGTQLEEHAFIPYTMAFTSTQIYTRKYTHVCTTLPPITNAGSAYSCMDALCRKPGGRIQLVT